MIVVAGIHLPYFWRWALDEIVSIDGLQRCYLHFLLFACPVDIHVGMKSPSCVGCSLFVFRRPCRVGVRYRSSGLALVDEG